MKKNTPPQLPMKQAHEQSVKHLRSLFYRQESNLVRVAVAKTDLAHAEADLECSTRAINEHIKEDYEDCLLDSQKLIGDLYAMGERSPA